MRPAALIADAGLAAILLLAAAPPAAARDAALERLDPSRYQSFVGNWTPGTRPLCAVIRNQGDWDRVLKPAPTMGRTRPFSPPAAFWQTKAVLLVARIVAAGNASDVFQVRRLERRPGMLQLDYRFTLTPPASSTMKWYLALAVAKPLPPVVRFKEGNRIVCTLRTDAPIPLTPRPPPGR